MTLEEAILARHSVRAYEERPIDSMAQLRLRDEIEACNWEGQLHIQLVTDHSEVFSNFLSHYEGFREIHSYLALVGPDNNRLDELCGYYGERLVLLAQQLGLSTCWIGGGFDRKGIWYKAEPGEKLCLIIAIGHGAEVGQPHKSKRLDQVCQGRKPLPPWFVQGVEFALLAPTAMNQQKFYFTLIGENGVCAEAPDWPFAKVDLGIAKYHFEIGAGRENFHWVARPAGRSRWARQNTTAALSLGTGALAGAGLYYARRGKYHAVLLGAGALLSGTAAVCRVIAEHIHRK